MCFYILRRRGEFRWSSMYLYNTHRQKIQYWCVLSQSRPFYRLHNLLSKDDGTDIRRWADLCVCELLMIRCDFCSDYMYCRGWQNMPTITEQNIVEQKKKLIFYCCCFVLFIVRTGRMPLWRWTIRCLHVSDRIFHFEQRFLRLYRFWSTTGFTVSHSLLLWIWSFVWMWRVVMHRGTTSDLRFEFSSNK